MATDYVSGYFTTGAELDDALKTAQQVPQYAAEAQNAATAAEASNTQAKDAAATAAAESGIAQKSAEEAAALIAHASVSGSLAQIPDGLAAPLTVLKADGSSQQSAAPTPSAPQPISGVASPVNLKRCGKNLLPYPYYHGTTRTSHGVTFTVNDDGTVTANGTSTGGAASFILRYNTPDLPNGTYMCSGTPAGGAYEKYNIVFSGIGGAGQLFETGTGVALTITNGGIRAIIQVQNGITANNLVFRPQIEIADAPTDYEPYAATNYSIPLKAVDGTEITLDAVGDVADRLEMRSDGTYFVTKNTARTVLTSASYNFSYGTSEHGYLYRNTGAVFDGSPTEVLCTHFVGLRSGDFSADTIGLTHGLNTTYLVIKDGTDDVAAFKAWLDAQNAAGTPVTLLYKYAQPETIELSEETQSALREIRSLAGFNTLYLSGGIAVPYIEVSYAVNLWSRIQNLETRVAALEAKVGA